MTSLSLTITSTPVEGDSGTTAFTFTVTRDGDLSGASTVSYAVVGAGDNPAAADDFVGDVLPTGVIGFAAGETTKVITIPVKGDAAPEFDEAFRLVLSDPVGATISTGTVQAAIVNDDYSPDVLLFSVAGGGSVIEGSSGASTLDFYVTRSGLLTHTASVAYSIVGAGSTPAAADDFANAAFPSGVVNFAIGEQLKRITVEINGDATAEFDEGFKLVLSDPVGAAIKQGTGDGLILNDDGTPPGVLSISGGGAKAEAQSASFTITRTGDSRGAASVSYAVTGSGGSPAGASDFVGAKLPSGTVSFAAGETVKTVVLAIANDTVVEPDETFTIALSNAVGASIGTATATATIQNDDTPPTLQEATATLNTAFANILRAIPGAADTVLVESWAAQMAAGTLTTEQALSKVVDKADATTSVATMAYEFFTGKIPSAAGMDYLVSPTGPNPNNLNAAYYQSFSIENRNINFAVNLGKSGEGAAKFQAEYGGLDLFAATTKAYQTIFGTAPTADKVHALLDPSFSVGGQTMTRAEYFAYYGQDGANGIGTKAAMVGWLLAEAEKANIGTYARSNAAFLMDLADGANYAVDIVGVYGKPEYAI